MIIRGNKWLKDTYAYQVFAAGMTAYIAKFMWLNGTNYDPEREYYLMLMSKVCAFIMGTAGILQVCINIGLIGDMWDKKKKRS